MRRLITLVLALPTMAFARTLIAITSGGLASMQYVVGSMPATIPLELVVTTDRTETGQSGI